MARLLLCHWNDEEAKERARRLERLGHVVHIVARAGAAFRSIDAFSPEAVVISLERLPSHGREVAVALRDRKSTRALPLLFLEGDREKVEKVRALLPDATYTTWARAAKALPRAIRNAPLAPVRPPSMMERNAGRTLAQKLGVTPQTTVAAFNAPDSFERLVGPVQSPPGGHAHRVFLFASSEAELARDFDRAAARVEPQGGFWIAWPKKAAKERSDLDMNTVRAYGLAREWVDYKVCSIDKTWSGVLFGRRRKGRLLD